MTYATPEAIRAALLETHERTLSDPATLAVFGGPVLIRELTAGQRLRAAAAARAENPDEPDMALFDAIRLHLCVVDPASGTPYADGRTDASLLSGKALTEGQYELVFCAGDYLRAQGAEGILFLDEIPVRFGVPDAGAHYHVPLLLSGFGYSTYRGS
jgi:hypothetical protein